MEEQAEYKTKSTHGLLRKEVFIFPEYIKKAKDTCQPQCFNEAYLSLGLISEVGEIAGKMKRVIRDGEEICTEDMVKELGDVLWYVSVLSDFRSEWLNPDVALLLNFDTLSASEKVNVLSSMSSDYACNDAEVFAGEVIGMVEIIAESLGSTLKEVADTNIKKLASRKQRNKINGSGDNR